MNKNGDYKIEFGNESKAFTLIELLVVISIIAVLMAIMMPALSRVREQGKSVVCQSRMRQWGIALVVYAQDNSSHLPYFGDDYSKEKTNDIVFWHEELAPYLDVADDGAARGRAYYDEIRQCPASTSTETAYIGVNFCWDAKTSPFYYGKNGNGVEFPAFNIAAIRDPSSTMALTDTGARWVYNPRELGFRFDMDGDGMLDSASQELPFNYGRPKIHMNGSNVLLLDGHSEWVSYEDLWLEQEDLNGRKSPTHIFWKL